MFSDTESKNDDDDIDELEKADSSLSDDFGIKLIDENPPDIPYPDITLGTQTSLDFTVKDALV